MIYTVPEQTMSRVLESIQKTAGQYATRLLIEAGLDRFLTTPPSPTGIQLVAAPEELSQLYHGVYNMLGEDFTRLFHRNYGEVTAAALLHAPAMAEMIAAGPSVPAAQQVRWFADSFAAWASRTWAQTTVSEDAVACYMELKECYSCAGISAAKRPLCASTDVIYRRLAHACLGRRIRVAETECAAMGAPHCRWALYK